MSTEISTSPQVLNWQARENPFKLFRPELDEVEQQLLGNFDELAAWCAELAASQIAIEEERAALERDQACLQAAQSELAAQQAALSAQQAEFATQQSAFQLQIQTATGVVVATPDEVLAWEEKLLVAEQEIELLREQTTAQANWAEQHKEERNQHEEQYSALELELEHVRNRAGELFDTLSCSRSEWELERHHWDQERKELQSLLAHQQAQIKDYLERHDTHGTEPQHPHPGQAIDASAADPATNREDAVVVGSVLAQFERIRNERAVRRRKAGEGT